MESLGYTEFSMASTASTSHASVTISRDHPEDVQQRQIYARVDDRPNHTLVFGDCVTIDVPPGDHVLKVNNTLYWKSVRFTVGEGEHAHFRLANSAGAFAFGALAVLGVGPLKLTIEKLS